MAFGPLEWPPRRAFRHREGRMQPAGRRSVVDIALQGGAAMTTPQVDRAKVLRRLQLGDAIYRHLTRAAALAVLVILGGIIISLFGGSWLALRTFGLNFLQIGRAHV